VSGTVEGDISPPATWENIAKANVAVWAGVHKADAKVGSAPTLKAINGINSFNPPVKAVYSMWPGDGHGPTNTILGLIPFTITNGEGLINPSENVYQWYKSILANGPRQPLSGTIITNPPPSDNPPIALTAKLTYTIEGDTVKLDASQSTGVAPNQWDSYSFGFEPNYGSPTPGTYGWKAVSPYSSTPIKIMEGVKKGDYLVKLTVRDKAGNKVSDTVIVTVPDAAPLKKVVAYSYVLKQLIFDDTTVEEVSAVFTTKTGKTYTNP
jgi:hypothetical protein